MRTKLPWFLVVISVAFNLFFAIGFLRGRSDMKKSRTLEGRAELMARRLGLEAEQRKAFEALVDEVGKLRDTMAPHRDAFLAEIVKDQPDQKVLDEFLNGPAADERRLKRLGIVRKMVNLLSPEQREKWTDLVKKRLSSSK